MENIWLNLTNLLKGFNIDKDCITLEKLKNIFNELVEKHFFEFLTLKEKINPNNLIYR